MLWRRGLAKGEIFLSLAMLLKIVENPQPHRKIEALHTLTETLTSIKYP